MKEKSYYQRFMEMTNDQREKEVAEFDKEFIADTFRPLTPSERKQWKKLQAEMKQEFRRKRGRPRTGEGVKVISLSVEKGLLAKADAFAKKSGITRAQLVAQGLERVMRQAAA